MLLQTLLTLPNCSTTPHTHSLALNNNKPAIYLWSHPKSRARGACVCLPGGPTFHLPVPGPTTADGTTSPPHPPRPSQQPPLGIWGTGASPRQEPRARDRAEMSAMLAARLDSTAIPSPQLPSPSIRLRFSPPAGSRSRSVAPAPRAAASATAVATKPAAAAAAPLSADRTVVRIGLPSKGRMAEQTLSLLKVPCFSTRLRFRCWV